MYGAANQAIQLGCRNQNLTFCIPSGERPGRKTRPPTTLTITTVLTTPSRDRSQPNSCTRKQRGWPSRSHSRESAIKTWCCHLNSQRNARKQTRPTVQVRVSPMPLHRWMVLRTRPRPRMSISAWEMSHEHNINISVLKYFANNFTYLL